MIDDFENGTLESEDYFMLPEEGMINAEYHLVNNFHILQLRTILCPKMVFHKRCLINVVENIS